MKNVVNGALSGPRKTVFAFMAQNKKLYIAPQSEVMQMGAECMKYTGPASVPSQDFAPKRRAEVF